MNTPDTTPRPWHAAEYADGRIEITGDHVPFGTHGGAHTHAVADMARNGSTGIANARLIVEAVNAYDSLRERVAAREARIAELEGALDDLVGFGAIHATDCDDAEHDSSSPCVYCAARAALKGV